MSRVARRFSALKSSPLGSEVCHYENTSNGDFLIDRHPERENVRLVGGGSGHGFEHDPAIGDYATSRIVEGGPVERGTSASRPRREFRNGRFIEVRAPRSEAPSLDRAKNRPAS